MDVSSKYVKMCEKAIEIQQQWKPQDGDFMFGKPDTWREKKDILIVGNYQQQRVAEYENKPEEWADHPCIDNHTDMFRTFDGGYEWEWENIGHPREFVWLLRQDQLQNIWQIEYNKSPTKLGWFGEFTNWIGIIYADDKNADETFNTMEQLWLAFCQKKLYNKTWNNEKENWINAATTNNK